MTTDLIVKVCLSVISIISALISAYVIPHIKSSTYSNEFETFWNFVLTIVQSADQIYNSDQGSVKKEYVVGIVTDYMNEKTHLGFTEDQIDAIIEGIVREEKALYGNKNSVRNSDNTDVSVFGGSV